MPSPVYPDIFFVNTKTMPTTDEPMISGNAIFISRKTPEGEV